MTDILNALVLLANFVLVPGLAYGSQLALGALGVTMIYAVLRFSNFAHGETMSFGAMITILTTWWLQEKGITFGVLPTALLALPVGIITTVVMCLLFDRVIYRYYRREKANPVTYLIVSVGILFILSGLVRFVIGPQDRVFADGERFIMKARAFKQMTGLDQGLHQNHAGRHRGDRNRHCYADLLVPQQNSDGQIMRAYSDNEDLALLSGINPAKVVTITWVITGALAAIAGTLYGLDKGYKPLLTSGWYCQFSRQRSLEELEIPLEQSRVALSWHFPNCY